MRAFAALCIPLFALCIVLQRNDPDAWSWTMAFGIVMIACTIIIRGVSNTWWLRIVAIPYVIWGIACLMQSSGQWFDGEVEREAAGLGICVVTLVVLSFAKHRTPRLIIPRHTSRHTS